MDAIEGEETATKLASDLLGIDTDEAAWSEYLAPGTVGFFYNRRGVADAAMDSASLRQFCCTLDQFGLTYHVARLPYFVRGNSPQVTVVLIEAEWAEAKSLAGEWQVVTANLQSVAPGVLASLSISPL